MAFKAPAPKLPSALKPGWIYFIREQDYLDPTDIGRYVKIGLTKRTVPIRIAEHQTGNPRREFEATPSSYIELMDYGETFLHHYFSADRIGGEWFDLDDAFLASDVRPVIDNLQVEMAAVASSFRRWKELNDVPSNGTTRPPTVAETGWGQDFTTAYEELTVAKAILDTHKNNLRTMLGTEKAIENIMHIQQGNRNPTFSKSVFEGLITPAQLAQCDSTTTSLSRSLKMLNKGQDLATLNPTVKQAFDASETGLISPSATNMSGAVLSPTQAMKDENLAMLTAMREVKVKEWACLKAQAKLIEALDDHLEIEGIVRWKREPKTETKFDKKLAKELFETEFNASFTPPATPHTYSTEFDYMRKYNP